MWVGRWPPSAALLGSWASPSSATPSPAVLLGLPAGHPLVRVCPALRAQTRMQRTCVSLRPMRVSPSYVHPPLIQGTAHSRCLASFCTGMSRFGCAGSHTSAVVEGGVCREAGLHRKSPGSVGSACLHHQGTHPGEVRVGFRVVCVHVCVSLWSWAGSWRCACVCARAHGCLLMSLWRSCPRSGHRRGPQMGRSLSAARAVRPNLSGPDSPRGDRPHTQARGLTGEVRRTPHVINLRCKEPCVSLSKHIRRAPAPSAPLSGTLSHWGAGGKPRGQLLGRLGASPPPPRDEGLCVHLGGPGESPRWA